MGDDGFGPVLRGGTQDGGHGVAQREAPPRPAHRDDRDDRDDFGPVVRGAAPWKPPQGLLRVAVSGALVVALVAVVGGVGLGLFLSAKIERIRVDGLNGNPLDELNVLVVGLDSRKGFTPEELQALGTEAVAGRRTDTIFLLSISGGRAAMLSFPRDLFVTQCDGAQGRINGAYASGGPSCLVKTVAQLTGIGIDNYVEVNLFGFSRIVEAVGGVPMVLDQPLVDRAAGLDLPAGCVVLDGRTAVGFVRARNVDATGDLGRIARQQRFLKELADEVISPYTLVNVPRLFRVVGAAGSSVTANRGLGPIDLIRLARAARGVTAGGLATYTVPATPRRVGGAAVLVPAEGAAEARFAEFRDSSVLRVPSPEEVAALQPGEVPLAIRNGSGVNGRASRARDVLAARGFPVTDVGNTDRVAATVVRYQRGQEAAAQRVANEVGGAEIEESRDVSGVVLVVGPDAQLDAPPPPAPPPGAAGAAPAPAAC